jgi:RNA polymerase sigma-70 factor (ECF subfamily)
LPYRDAFLPGLPELRRFAVALIAPEQSQACQAADDLVLRAVQCVMREPSPTDEAQRRRALHAAVVRYALGGAATTPAAEPRNALTAGLGDLQLQHRAALLLVSLQGFSYDDAASILGVSRNVLLGRLATARQLLARRMEPSDASGGHAVPHLRLVQ